MKVHESAENYLETILVLSKRNGNVRSIDIATELGFSKPSISNAMKQFREQGYISVDSNGSITLTKSGLEIANRVYERHLLLTKCLMALGVSEATAKEDACRIEHIISQESFNKIKEHCKSVDNIKDV
ncbi:MAG: Transcriptional regulator MntR [Firmicutes bacterium ADurb.Bin419]|nr:MAG: Transcriptional regulator MntR [Firmicutes bacterium ADurb.Bin419]